MAFNWSNLLNVAVVGVFSGAGSSVGTWLATRHIIKKFERMSEKKAGGKKDGKATKK